MAESTNFCPHCGEAIPARALACPECGSDAKTGWADEEEIGYQAVEIPESWPETEWTPEQRSALPAWIRITAFIALAGLVFLILSGLF